jgi:hypothetical protein
MPAQLTVEFLPALDWSGYGPDAADDEETVSACFDDITGRMQAALDRLAAERPYPLLAGYSLLTARASADAARRVGNLGRAIFGAGRHVRP